MPTYRRKFNKDPFCIQENFAVYKLGMNLVEFGSEKHNSALDQNIFSLHIFIHLNGSKWSVINQSVWVSSPMHKFQQLFA